MNKPLLILAAIVAIAMLAAWYFQRNDMSYRAPEGKPGKVAEYPLYQE